MGMVERLRLWREIRRVRPEADPAAETGGREGEDLFRQLVSASARFKGTRLLAGRRIPSGRQGRRREIDLIVCTPGVIHLIEVKNWSGRLSVAGGAWRQTRRGGEVVDHPDLIESNRLKHEAVIEYLRGRGVPVDEAYARERIVTKVVFTNPRLDLDPEIEARPDVFSRRELDDHLERPRDGGRARRMVASVVDFCLDSEAARGGSLLGSLLRKGATGPHARIVACLEEAETWDQLRLHGGRAIAGDLIALKVGPKVFRKPDLEAMAGGRPIHLRWSRDPFWGFLKAVIGLGWPGSLEIGRARWPLGPADTITFHDVGDPEPRTRRLVELDGMVLG